MMVACSAGKQRDSFGLVFLWGEPGCGKTSRVKEAWPDAFVMTQTDRGWMDTYDGEGAWLLALLNSA